MSKTNDNSEIATRVSVVTIILNLGLSVGKLIAGVIGNSGAMVSDAIHSASDVITTIIVIFGVKISEKEADKTHPYGHERLECIAALALALMLGATGFWIGFSGVNKIIHYESIATPGIIAVVAAIISIATKEWMYWYTIRAAKKINSGAMKADAWHHRSDALSSVGSLVGIVGARLGFPVMDAIASVIISLLIIKVSWDIMYDAIDKMIDRACNPEIVSEMKKEILKQPGVLGLDTINTRLFGDRVFVDIEIRADGELKLVEAHDIAENVHDAIERNFPEVKHCMVHVNPD